MMSNSDGKEKKRGGGGGESKMFDIDGTGLRIEVRPEALQGQKQASHKC